MANDDTPESTWEKHLREENTRLRELLGLVIGRIQGDTRRLCAAIGHSTLDRTLAVQVRDGLMETVLLAQSTLLEMGSHRIPKREPEALHPKRDMM